MLAKVTATQSTEAEALVEDDAALMAEDQDTDEMDDEGDDEGDDAELVSFRLKDLVNKVSEVSDIDKRKLTDLVKVVLKELGASLVRGEQLAMPGLGRIRATRAATEERPTLKLKMRPFDPNKVKGGPKSRSTTETDDTEALADDSEAV